MPLRNGYTPKTAAADIALGWLVLAYRGKTSDMEDYGGTPSERKALRKQIAKLHNRILDASGLDGTPLSETPET